MGNWEIDPRFTIIGACFYEEDLWELEAFLVATLQPVGIFFTVVVEYSVINLNVECLVVLGGSQWPFPLEGQGFFVGIESIFSLG